MDFLSILTEHFVVVVMVACLIIGYIIKHATFMKWLPNNDIPIVLAVFGAVVNPIVSGLSVENVIYGALMGLASTGMHQAFKKFIENTKNEGD
jgi:hypothetical protein